MSDVLELFYLEFLRVDRREIEVVKLAEDELITRCKNPCPILRLSELLSVDARHACIRPFKGEPRGADIPEKRKSERVKKILFN